MTPEDAARDWREKPPVPQIPLFERRSGVRVVGVELDGNAVLLTVERVVRVPVEKLSEAGLL